MRLKQLQHFVLLAQERNFHKAAARAYLSQPALSHSIKALENSLDAQLFDRDRKQVSLTGFGEILLVRAKKILFESENFERELMTLKQGDSGLVTFGLATTFAAAFAAPVLSEWQRQRNKIRTQLLIENSQLLTENLHQERIEFAVVDLRDASDFDDLDIREIATHPGGFFARKDHPLHQLTNVSNQDVFDYGLVSIALPRKLEASLMKNLALQKDQPLLQCECDNFAACEALMLATDLILPSLNCAIDASAKKAQIQQLQIATLPAIEGKWGIACLKGRFIQPATKALMDDFLHAANQYVERS